MWNCSRCNEAIPDNFDICWHCGTHRDGTASQEFQMAYCPKCNGEMGQEDVVCPHCGYDFPPERELEQRRIGIEYSVWADIALAIGTVVAGFSCLGSAIGSLVAVITGQFVQGLVIGPVGFFLSLAMLVVFLRVRKL